MFQILRLKINGFEFEFLVWSPVLIPHLNTDPILLTPASVPGRGFTSRVLHASSGDNVGESLAIWSVLGEVRHSPDGQNLVGANIDKLSGDPISIALDHPFLLL